LSCRKISRPFNRPCRRHSKAQHTTGSALRQCTSLHEGTLRDAASITSWFHYLAL
jgi:hypothetical protein